MSFQFQMVLPMTTVLLAAGGSNALPDEFPERDAPSEVRYGAISEGRLLSYRGEDRDRFGPLALWYWVEIDSGRLHEVTDIPRMTKSDQFWDPVGIHDFRPRRRGNASVEASDQEAYQRRWHLAEGYFWWIDPTMPFAERYSFFHRRPWGSIEDDNEYSGCPPQIPMAAQPLPAAGGDADSSEPRSQVRRPAIELIEEGPGRFTERVRVSGGRPTERISEFAALRYQPKEPPIDPYRRYYDFLPLSPHSVRVFVLHQQQMTVWHYSFQYDASRQPLAEGLWSREALFRMELIEPEHIRRRIPPGVVLVNERPFSEPFHAHEYDGKWLFVTVSGDSVYCARKDDQGEYHSKRIWHSARNPIVALLRDADSGSVHAFGKDYYFELTADIDPQPCRNVLAGPRTLGEPLHTLLECSRVLHAGRQAED